MPRDPRWLYRFGRSAMRQILAASSKISSIGGSSRPPAASAARLLARITRSVSAATSGAAAALDSVSKYKVSRLPANPAALNAVEDHRAGRE